MQMVKAEHPLLEKVTFQYGVLLTAKNSLEKIAGQATDLYYQMKASEDKSCRDKAPEVKAVLDKMNEHLAETRELLAANKTVDASHGDLQGLLDSLCKLCELAMAHGDGFKVLKKRYVAMLT